MADPDLSNRRPLKSRSTGWAAMIARGAVRSGITPNGISVLGVLAAALGAWALVCAPWHPALYLAGALGIQLRLLANMIDGMVAVEGGRGSPTGPLYNEAPDRIEDALLLVAAGYATAWPWLGWAACALAIFTAYVRALGGSLGFAQDFRGPMAKPHRMAALTLGCVAAFVEALTMETRYALAIALGVIVAGTALTGVRRLVGIARQLRAAG
ncbi:MAG: CDP-alcohol phosphatidyltransferase family protein [Sphingomonadaceae bacterium]|nr:CDP-alcohol phosphatidyltransferase family protein [Sphingomonadaceae bacterium]